jgi:hypothetical protein
MLAVLTPLRLLPTSAVLRSKAVMFGWGAAEGKRRDEGRSQSQRLERISLSCRWGLLRCDNPVRVQRTAPAPPPGAAERGATRRSATSSTVVDPSAMQKGEMRPNGLVEHRLRLTGGSTRSKTFSLQWIEQLMSCGRGRGCGVPEVNRAVGPPSEHVIATIPRRDVRLKS